MAVTKLDLNKFADEVRKHCFAPDFFERYTPVEVVAKINSLIGMIADSWWGLVHYDCRLKDGKNECKGCLHYMDCTGCTVSYLGDAILMILAAASAWGAEIKLYDILSTNAKEITVPQIAVLAHKYVSGFVSTIDFKRRDDSSIVPHSALMSNCLNWLLTWIKAMGVSPDALLIGKFDESNMWGNDE